MGSLYLKKQEWDEAEKYYKKQIELAPLSANTHHSMGSLYLNRGRFQEALAEFKETNRLRNGYGTLEIAIIDELRGLFDQAEYYFNAALTSPIRENQKIRSVFHLNIRIVSNKYCGRESKSNYINV